ncbi:putative myosin class II heavy chain (MHC) [Aspergillus homomorphus CBS 101889]|uniref:Myosin class II heavy chain n=1 Tax=Aspergillus homomorphus (strain CBS 101889) TaxID=1450537 RepID=A0A395HSC9_ASPHC|nr:myosin class II heavy chain [Aspergillus homomorphus CBS 101889]RAL10399.1 myosin class II heavy chain [Aspergillus homomorphus CBS 101889]
MIFPNGVSTDLGPSASSANSALSPPSPPPSTQPFNLRVDSLLTVPLTSFPTSPGASNFSAAGSPGRSISRSVTPNPPNSLPVLPKYRGAWESSTSSPENRRAESSVYYTTAWGSPYAAPSPRTISWSLSQSAVAVDRGSGNSSPTSMSSVAQHGPETNNPDLLRPSARDNSTRRPYSRLLSRSPFGRKGGKSIKDFTQDWINQYLSGQPRTERGNWLSDDSGSEAPSFFTAQNFAEDTSDDWLGLEQDTRDEDLLRTPTLADFGSRKTASGRGEGSKRNKEYLHKRTDTLRQEDFWGFAYDKDPPLITMDSTEAHTPAGPSQHQTPSLLIEKPLPPPPVDEIRDAPSSTECHQGSFDSQAVTGSGSEQSLVQPPVQRQRKKILWRGKACNIALPYDDRRGTEESGYRLLTFEDVEERLRSLNEQGYDTRGFSVCASNDLTDLELGGLSCPIFPDPGEVHEEFLSGKYEVGIPNKADWDAYVANLQEEKLRALGVSLGDDEPGPSISPAMSQMASFPGLVSSPPIPTASAASNPLSMSHHFSPQLNQPGNPATGLGSLASPASQFSLQTPFLGVDQNLLPPYTMPFQPTPPAQGSLTPQSFFNPRQPGVASTMAGTLPNLNSILSPVSPMNEQGAFHPGYSNPSFGDPSFGDQTGMPKDTYGDHDVLDHVTEGHLLRPLRTPTENLDNFHASTVEIAQPTPRGHSRGQNLSETLQKGLDNFGPTYHLEESFDRQQLDDGGRGQHLGHFDGTEILKSRWAFGDNIGVQQLPHHMHQFYDGNYSGEVAHEGSDIDTNPSLSGTPRHAPHNNNVPWHQSRPSAGSYVGGHRSKLSTSSLNVAAQEFKPIAAASSQPLPFQENSFQFQAGGDPVFTFGSQSELKPSNTGFDLNAPSFTPGVPNNNTKRTTGSGEFKFSTASLNVAAPAFNPGGSTYSAAPEKTTNAQPKIFSDVDISQASSKASKKSKAIPIVRPDDIKEDKRSKDESEHDNGRPGRPDRHKRARRGDELSETEAQLSVPAALAEATNLQSSHMRHPSHVSAEGKENIVPQAEGAPATIPKPISAQDDKSAERKDTPISEASTWIPQEMKNESAAAPESEAEIKHTEPEPLHEIQETIEPNTTKDQERTVPESADNDLSSAELRASVPQHVLTATETTENPANSRTTPKRERLSEPAHVEDDEDSPDEEELNAVMEQLNDDSDVGIERISTPQPNGRLPESVMHVTKEKRHVPADIRSEAPSPSPGRGPAPHTLDVPKLDFEAQSQFSASPSKGVVSGFHSPVRKLLSRTEHISDWDDVISSGEDEKLANRSRFFDRRINDLVGSTIDERLTPLERALGMIQNSLMAITSGSHTRLWSASADGDNSDADDEEDEYEENESFSTRSHMRQREKLDKLKAVVLDALASHVPQQVKDEVTASELTQLRESVSALQALTIQKLSQDPVSELREMMQELVSSQRDVPPSDTDEVPAESLMLQVEGLKNMLRLADERANQEYKIRREAQDSVAELQRLLRVVEEDAVRHSHAAEDAEARLLYFKAEKIPYYETIQHKAESLESERETLNFTLNELSSKNISLQGTLDEYRVMADNYKRDSEQSKGALEEARAENKSLRGIVEQLKTRLEDGLSIRQNLGNKLDQLQEEMATVIRDVTKDQSSWRRREEALNAQCNELRSAYGRESKLREKLEYDIEGLEEKEREAAKLKFIFGQSQQENARLEELVANLRLQNHDLELKAARFEREFNEARESSRVEIQRTRNSLESDLEAANSQVNIVRAELEAQILRLQSQMDNVRLDNDTARERYEMLLEEAAETKVNALATAAQAQELAVEEQRRNHERVLNDLRERHARALHNASEDRQRGESHLLERLALSEDKANHLQDRVQHLEERLQLAQEAARAAAEAAQSAKSSPVIALPAHTSTPSMSYLDGSMVPEKISPQALRESILVLQDQLQQRETRIEELEQEISTVDKDAPNKVKERDTEIAWLRELLGVRIDDLQDVINIVSQPSFNQNAVRDAAIRLKANLQMQQQERERMHSGQAFPSIPSLAELTASPRSLPLAAAAAWGNWRKGRENVSSEQTPSKQGGASGFLSGLLTPPASNLRQGPPSSSSSAAANGRRPSEARPLRNYNTTPKQSNTRTSRMRELPSTPPLLRRSSYDHDAEPTDYAHSSFHEDAESTADGLVSASPRETTDGPFGPQITSPTSS